MLRVLIEVKFDTIPFIRKHFLFAMAKTRKTHDMESCKEADNGENVEVPQEGVKNAELERISAQEVAVESVSDSN